MTDGRPPELGLVVGARPPEPTLEPALAEALVAEGLVADATKLAFEHLSGGVSADLVRVRDADSGQSWCAKRPLTRLRVKGDWQVSQDRWRSEVDWLRTVHAWRPDAVPRVVACLPELEAFVMEDLAPPRWQPWKPMLLDGRIDAATGSALGSLVGEIHRRSMETPALAENFEHQALFHALRVRPFLHAATDAHPDLRSELRALERDLRAGDRALVHGDVSPKNVLVREDGRVALLDAECAHWAAPHFDAAFMLSHVMLKWARAPEDALELEALARAFRDAWTTARAGSHGDPVDVRCTLLVPALLLARVDGLSPVDYLEPERAARVRSFARTQLRVRPEDHDRLLARYGRAMGDID